MTRYGLTVLIVCLTILFSDSSVAENNKIPVSAVVARVDGQLVSELGLSIKKISMLLDEGATSYHPKWYLKQNGKYKILKEMERDGFLEIDEVSQLPDGSAVDGGFVRYIATDKGADVISAVK